MILYFSGTGNSEYIAKKLSNFIQDEIVSINEKMKSKLKSGTLAPFHSERPYVFICPTYAWQLPRVVADFINTSEFTGSKEVYFIMTCGEDIGNAEKYIKNLCRDKAFNFNGLMSVVMPENYIAMYEAPLASVVESLIAKAQPVVLQAAEKISRREPFEGHKPTVADHLKSGLVNGLFYSFFVSAKGYYTTDACVNCGKCEKLCPLDNISMTGGKPAWDNRCTQCMACICGCPAVAIEYKNKTQGKARYWCPEERD